MTSTDQSAGDLAVLGLPELAEALSAAGLRVVTADNFRAAASAANAALKVAPLPIVMADVAVAGTSPWVEKVVRTCPVAFVAIDLVEGQKRVAGNTTSAARVTPPASLQDILAAVGLTSPSVQGTIELDGSVSGASLAPEQADPIFTDLEVPAGGDVAPSPVETTSEPAAQVSAPPDDVAPDSAPAPVLERQPGPDAAATPTPPPPAPSFDFWGAAPAAPLVPTVPQPGPTRVPAPAAPVEDLWDQTPTAPAPVTPPTVAPATTHQFGVPQPVTGDVAAELEGLDDVAPDAVTPPPVTPLPPVPDMPVPPLDQPIDRVPPTTDHTPAVQQPTPAPATARTVHAPVAVGEQIGVDTGYSPTLGRKLAPTVVTLAGKGGVGKTSIAYALAQRAATVGGLRTVLIDGNRGQGDLRTYLSLTRSGLPTILDAATTGDPAAAIVTPDRLNANRPDGAEQLAIALVQAPPNGLADPATITSGLYYDVITAARGMADLVVVDTQIVEGSERGMFDELTIPMLAAHAYGVGISDLSRPGVDNLITHLSQFIREGVPVERLMTMLNRVPATTEYDLQRTSDGLSRYGAFLAAVPADPEVHSAMAYGTSIHDNPVLAPVLDAVLMRVTGNPVFTPARQLESADTGAGSSRRRGGFFRLGRGERR